MQTSRNFPLLPHLSITCILREHIILILIKSKFKSDANIFYAFHIPSITSNTSRSREERESRVRDDTITPEPRACASPQRRWRRRTARRRSSRMEGSAEGAPAAAATPGGASGNSVPPLGRGGHVHPGSAGGNNSAEQTGREIHSSHHSNHYSPVTCTTGRSLLPKDSFPQHRVVPYELCTPWVPRANLPYHTRS